MRFPKHPRSSLPRGSNLELLEGRRMMSVSPTGWGHDNPGPQAVSALQFSLVPAAVKTGLDKLATAGGLTDPTATTPVQLDNHDGVETYTVTLRGTGTVSRFTVNAAGTAVAAPTQSTTTFAKLTTAAAAEVTAIAKALKLTAPTSTTAVHVTTTSAGATTYSVVVSGATTTTANGHTVHGPSAVVMVDAAGNPVGNQALPTGVIPSKILAGLNAAAPKGATPLTATSTTLVRVGTVDGVTTYSATFVVGTARTTVTVDTAGAAVALDTRASSTFASASTAAKAELQSLATALGYTGTIAATQAVTVVTEANGTKLYVVTLSVPDSATSSGRSHSVTLVVDANGNPTVLPDGLGGH